jgi:hypothetical protein
MRATREIARLFLLSFLVKSSVLVIPDYAQAEPIERPFNQLTSFIVSEDRRTVELFGIYNPHGSREAIPYDRLFADAFGLADERLDQGIICPGFTLLFPAAFPTQWAAIQKRLADADTELGVFLSRNQQAHEAYIDAALDQAFKEARAAIRTVFKARGYSEHDIDWLLAQVKTADDLKAVIQGMQREGVVSSDDSLLNMALFLAVEKYKQTKGNIFFFPPGLTAAYAGIPIFAEPHFFGIEPNSQLARIVLEGDVALKRLSADKSLKETLAFHQTYLEWKFRNLQPAEIKADVPVMSLYLQPKLIVLSVSSDKHVVSFEHTEVAVILKPHDWRQPQSAANRQYSDFLTQHFDDYAQEIEPLWTIRELYKIVAATRFLKSMGVVLHAPLDNSWQPPRQVAAVWQAASLGTGTGTISRVAVDGGVSLHLMDATTVTPLPAQRGEDIRAASAQLDAVFKSHGSGVCYDGREGCVAGVPLGFIKIGSEQRGSAGLSPEVLAKMKSRPELSKLLDDEQGAKTAWTQTQDEIRQAEASLSTAQNQQDKGRLQVELSKALQKASNAKSVLDTAQVKVEQGATMIVEHK